MHSTICCLPYACWVSTICQLIVYHCLHLPCGEDICIRFWRFMWNIKDMCFQVRYFEFSTLLKTSNRRVGEVTFKSNLVPLHKLQYPCNWKFRYVPCFENVTELLYSYSSVTLYWEGDSDLSSLNNRNLTETCGEGRRKWFFSQRTLKITKSTIVRLHKKSK